MKKAFIAIIAAFAVSGAFAQTVSVTLDIDTDAVQFVHTDVKNDEYVADADLIQSDQVQFLRNGDYGDGEFRFEYQDAEGRFGGALASDLGDVFSGSGSLSDLFSDCYVWSNLGKAARLQLGKYTYRAAEKIGGDKDLGVFDLVIDRYNNTMSIETRDSLAQQAEVIGLLGQGVFGPLEVGVFAAPDAYFIGRRYDTQGVKTGSEAQNTIPGYYAYNFGGNLKLNLPDTLSLGASYRQIHTTATNTTSTGDILNDWGLYARISALQKMGLELGVGYSGRLAYVDGAEVGDPVPVESAVHVDAVYTSGALKAALYNNVSFFSVGVKDTLSYDAAIAAVADIYADESSLVLYNELVVSYALAGGALVPSLTARNYYAFHGAVDGTKGQDYGLDVLTIQALLTVPVSENMEVRGGLKFVNTAYNTPAQSDVLQNSSFAIGIPIGLTLKW